MTIRARLALGVALLTVLVVFVVSAVQFVALNAVLARSEHDRLDGLVPVLVRSLEEQRRDSPTAPLDAGAVPRNVDVRVLDDGGGPATSVLVQTDDFPPVPASEPPGYRTVARHMVLVERVTVNGRAATVQLASDLLRVVNARRAYLQALAVTAPAAALLTALLSFAFAGRLLRPLAQLEAAAARLGRHGDLRAPLPGAGRRDELGRLAGTLQTTFAQLATVREREEDFTHAAAHDLRSPLAALKTRLQGSLTGPRSPAELRDDISEALSDVDRMQALTEHLLLLAHGARTIQRLPLDLARLAGESVDRARERAPDVRLDYETWGDTTVYGDETLLTHLVDNLIENGLRHGRGADMRICVGGEAHSVVLSMRDSGPGVPEPALERLTEPFYRADPSRAGQGNGLGLAIVRRVAEAHGATLRFEPRRPSGLHVLLEFSRGEQD